MSTLRNHLAAGALRFVVFAVFAGFLVAQGGGPGQQLELGDLGGAIDAETLQRLLQERAKNAKKGVDPSKAAAEGDPKPMKLRSRRVTGRIVGVNGKPLAGVGVILGGTKTLRTVDCLRAPRATTDAEGRYAFDLEPPLVSPKPIAKPKLTATPGPIAPLDDKGAEALEKEFKVGVDAKFLDEQRELAAKIVANKAAIQAAKEDKARRTLLVVCGEGFTALTRAMPKIDFSAVEAPRPAKTEEERLLELGAAVLAQTWSGRAKPAADEVVLPQLTLRPGQALRGRVLDQNGKPLAEVRLEARDLLGSRRYTGVNRSKVFVSYGTTAADGSFELPGLFSSGAVVTATLKGHYVQTREVVGEQELQLLMRATPEVVGKIVAEAPKMPKVSVTVRYEVSSASQKVKVEKDGVFRFFPKYPHRFRITASPSSSSDRKKLLTAYSPVLSRAPEQELVLRLAARPKPKPKPKTKKRKPLVTRQQRLAKIGMGVGVVDARTGRPLRNFRAGFSWLGKGTKVNLGYYAGRAARVKGKPGKQAGYVRLPGPTNPESLGVLMVTSPGYAPYVRGGIPFRPGDLEGVRVEMVPESMMAGKVVSKTTGKPMSGVRITLSQTDPKRGPKRTFYASTSSLGTFQLKGLGPGLYSCTARYGGVNSTAQTIELREEDYRGDLRFELGRGLKLSGKVEGIEIGKNWSVELLAQSSANYFFRSNSTYRPTGRRVKLGEDGTFTFTNIGAGEYEVGLVIPRDSREGPVLRIPVEPVKIRGRDARIIVDASEDHPGRIQGKLQLRGAKIDPKRLLVVCTAYQPSYYYYSYYNSYVNLSGSRSRVGADGSFSIREMAGKYQLKVFDVKTGVLMLQTRAPIELKAGQELAKKLDLEVTEVTVRLKPASEGGQVVASWLNLIVEQPRPEMFGIFGFFGGSSYGRRGTGVSLVGHRAGEPLKLLLPNYKTQLQVYSDVGLLSRARKRPTGNLGDGELEAGREQESEIEISVSVPTAGFEPEPPKKKPAAAAAQEDR